MTRCEHPFTTTDRDEPDPELPWTWTLITYCDECGQVLSEVPWLDRGQR